MVYLAHFIPLSQLTFASVESSMFYLYLIFIKDKIFVAETFWKISMNFCIKI